MSFSTVSVKNLVRSAFNVAGFDIGRRRITITVPFTVPSIKKLKSLSDKFKPLSDKFKMYHVGCGALIADGFLNIDCNFESYRSSKTTTIASCNLYAVEGRPSTYLLQYDLRNGIPAATDSLEVIYHSHFFEHLTDHEGIAFLSECHRCLAPGGVMRFAVPDFELWCGNYVSKNSEFFNWYRSIYLGNNTIHYKTNALVFMGMLYNWGHRMAYDYGSLVERLGTTGFTKVRRADWSTSEKIPNIASVEEPKSERRVESLVVECTK
jgi:predicted SAM-dependent methyltransferase